MNMFLLGKIEISNICSRCLIHALIVSMFYAIFKFEVK